MTNFSINGKPNDPLVYLSPLFPPSFTFPSPLHTLTSTLKTPKPSPRNRFPPISSPHLLLSSNTFILRTNNPTPSGPATVHTTVTHAKNKIYPVLGLAKHALRSAIEATRNAVSPQAAIDRLEAGGIRSGALVVLSWDWIGSGVLLPVGLGPSSWGVRGEWNSMADVEREK